MVTKCPCCSKPWKWVCGQNFFTHTDVGDALVDQFTHTDEEAEDGVEESVRINRCSSCGAPFAVELSDELFGHTVFVEAQWEGPAQPVLSRDALAQIVIGGNDRIVDLDLLTIAARQAMHRDHPSTRGVPLTGLQVQYVLTELANAVERVQHG